MVLSEYEIDPESITSMTAALERAYTELSAGNVFGPERVQIQRAWDAWNDAKIDRANAYMRQAATATAAAIDSWEGRRAATQA
jgi:hypothetical protein